jgi:hypothetical protein
MLNRFSSGHSSSLCSDLQVDDLVDSTAQRVKDEVPDRAAQLSDAINTGAAQVELSACNATCICTCRDFKADPTASTLHVENGHRPLSVVNG